MIRCWWFYVSYLLNLMEMLSMFRCKRDRIHLRFTSVDNAGNPPNPDGALRNRERRLEHNQGQSNLSCFERRLRAKLCPTRSAAKGLAQSFQFIIYKFNPINFSLLHFIRTAMVDDRPWTSSLEEEGRTDEFRFVIQ